MAWARGGVGEGGTTSRGRSGLIEAIRLLRRRDGGSAIGRPHRPVRNMACLEGSGRPTRRAGLAAGRFVEVLLYREARPEPVLRSIEPTQQRLRRRCGIAPQIPTCSWRRQGHHPYLAAARLVVGAQNWPAFDVHTVRCSVARVDHEREVGGLKPINSFDGGANGGEVGIGPL